MTHIYGLLRIALLDDTDSSVRDKDEENDKGLYECAPPARVGVVFKESEDERNDSGSEQNQDQLVLELLEDEFP